MFLLCCGREIFDHKPDRQACDQKSPSQLVNIGQKKMQSNIGSITKTLQATISNIRRFLT